eukprot:CAMPEP_0184478366 /NCGR_PEP_ID=MMETSP0113_2-20130426/412_1 /TAXON_ID=91329 /ORGANISM="Norrisiella sphaerica, Strain BC52" /LENGTH=148 /DNA_ID=CAMNT_0026856133 /DNA_START=83 /DNA_END=529 /DNA_ORIENTATION=+
MKSVALYVSVAVNVILAMCLVLAATRTNSLGAPAPVSRTGVSSRVAPAMNLAKNAGMAAAVGGITMMGQQAAPVQAHEFVRTTMPQERVMARDFQFQTMQAPQVYQETAEVTPSLKRYFLSLLAGGGVVLAIYGALSAVARFDRIDRV